MAKQKKDALIEEIVGRCAHRDTPGAGTIPEPGTYRGALAPYEALGSAVTLGALRLSNRCVIAPLSLIGGQFAPTEETCRFYLERSAAGLLMTGPVSPVIGGDPMPMLRWVSLNERLHARGAKIFLQIRMDGTAPEKLAAFASAAPSGSFDGICLYARESQEGLEESLRLLRGRLGRSFPILLRVSLSPAVLESGLTPDKKHEPPSVAEQLVFFTALAAAGADAFEVSLGCPDTPWLLEPASQLPAGCFAEAARAVRTHFLCLGIDAAVLAFGRLSDPDAAETLLRRRDCDLISLDGAGIHDPGWCEKVLSGQASRIVPSPLPRCRVESGQERIAVIGGGARGLCCAIRAAEQGHTVDLYDEAETPGGDLARFRSAASVEKQNLLRYLLREAAEKPSLRILSGTRADAALLGKSHYDRLIFACRPASLISPNIPGWGEVPFLTAESFSHEALRQWRNKRVAVLGGDALACDIAWSLQSEGRVKRAVLITDGPDIMPDEASADRAWLRHHLAQRGGVILCRFRPKRMRKNLLVLEDVESGKERHVVCDLVVLASRQPAPLRLYDEAVREQLAPEIRLL